MPLLAKIVFGIFFGLVILAGAFIVLSIFLAVHILIWGFIIFFAHETWGESAAIVAAVMASLATLKLFGRYIIKFIRDMAEDNKEVAEEV